MQRYSKVDIQILLEGEPAMVELIRKEIEDLQTRYRNRILFELDVTDHK